MELKEAENILERVKNDRYPPTNPIVLSEAQYTLAKAGKPKPAACIAQWIWSNEGGNIDFDDWKRICEIE